jgi:DUF4097 and DUF4098 domain-containing protein YvlB
MENPQNAVSALKIKVNNCNVVIKTTTGASYLELTSISSKEFTKMLSNDLTLTVTQEKPANYCGILLSEGTCRFRGIKQLFASSRASTFGTLTVYLNEDLLLDSIDVTAAAGNVSLTGIVAQTVKIDTVFSPIAVSDCDCSSLKLKSMLGDIKTDFAAQFSLYDSLNITAETTLGDIRISVASSVDTFSVTCDGAREFSINGKNYKDDYIRKAAFSADSVYVSSSFGRIYLKDAG